MPPHVPPQLSVSSDLVGPLPKSAGDGDVHDDAQSSQKSRPVVVGSVDGSGFLSLIEKLKDHHVRSLSQWKALTTENARMRKLLKRDSELTCLRNSDDSLSRLTSAQSVTSTDMEPSSPQCSEQQESSLPRSHWHATFLSNESSLPLAMSACVNIGRGSEQLNIGPAVVLKKSISFVDGGVDDEPGVGSQGLPRRRNISFADGGVDDDPVVGSEGSDNEIPLEMGKRGGSGDSTILTGSSKDAAAAGVQQQILDMKHTSGEERKGSATSHHSSDGGVASTKSTSFDSTSFQTLRSTWVDEPTAGSHGQLLSHVRESQMSGNSVDMDQVGGWDDWDRDSGSASSALPLPNSLSQAGMGSRASLDHRQFLASGGRSFGRWCRASNFVVRPFGLKRLAWDVCGLMFLLYDVIVIPLQVFEAEDDAFAIFMGWVTLFFWSADMISSTITGYVSKGVTVMELRRIMIHYLKTWFLIDLLVVGIDWFINIMNFLSTDSSGSSKVSSFGRLLKVLRIVRTVRLLRLLKLKRFITQIADRVNSERVSLLMQLFQLVVFLCFVNHFLACIWYLIGSIGRKAGLDNWIDTFHFADKDMGYRYTSSVHWSLTQFTPASMDVQPTNVAERTFAIFMVVIGLILFSSFVSSITGLMSQLRQLGAETTKQFWLLRCYLTQEQVPAALAIRVQRYLEFSVSSQKNSVNTEQLHILRFLTDHLRDELQGACCLRHATVHPLFSYITQKSHRTMQHMAVSSMSQTRYAEGDSMFAAMDIATYMAVVISGSFVYQKRREEQVVVDGTHWICEPVIWTNWIHLGRLDAACDAEVLLIDAKQFGQQLRAHISTWRLAQRYGGMYVDRLNGMTNNDLSDLPAGPHEFVLLKAYVDNARQTESLRRGKENAAKDVLGAMGSNASNGSAIWGSSPSAPMAPDAFMHQSSMQSIRSMMSVRAQRSTGSPKSAK